MARAGSHPICVIGVGNELRGDDAVGLLAVRRLMQTMPGMADWLESSGEVTGLLEAFERRTAVILVDAIIAGGMPGSLYRWSLGDGLGGDGELALLSLRSSTHTLSVADALALARAMGMLPPTVIVFALEAQSFEYGAGLSGAVDAALETLLTRLQAELLALSAEGVRCTSSP